MKGWGLVKILYISLFSLYFLKTKNMLAISQNSISNCYLNISDEEIYNPNKIVERPIKNIELNIRNNHKFKINRKKYIDFSHWNVSEINIFENKEIYLKIVKEIRGINHIVFENKNLGIIKRLNLSTEAILSISNDNISFFPEEITSKENIVKNQNSDETNPKIIKFNEEKIKNPIVYEIVYKGYMFKLIGNENLYQNQEIKRFIRYLKSLEIYM